MERFPALAMMSRGRGMRLKVGGGDAGTAGLLEAGGREISARRMVGDVESELNRTKGGGGHDGDDEDTSAGEKPWWRNVGMEEGL